jgi:hypothetical protein
MTARNIRGVITLTDEAREVLCNALDEYARDAWTWTYHQCDGPREDGTNPCRVCHSISKAIIEAARTLALDELADELQSELDTWQG